MSHFSDDGSQAEAGPGSNPRLPPSPVVHCATSPAPGYVEHPATRAPELPSRARRTSALEATRKLLLSAGFDAANAGSESWNPLADVIRRGDRVVLKPNWVLHRNLSDGGMDCLVTHTDVIEAVLHYVSKAGPGEIVVGDAPLQGCSFEALMKNRGVPEMVGRFGEAGREIHIRDFRRTLLPDNRLGATPKSSGRSLEGFVLFDLGADSLLEPITKADSEFRVTMYDPDSLKRRHAPGVHQYLVAREMIDADVVINMPKLKTHKKSCITGALKNVIGINGHKEYLPHHRKGSAAQGGDCYEERSRIKGAVEDLLDRTNHAKGGLKRSGYANAARCFAVLGKAMGVDDNYEGSWHGNDTIWRTSLDLQKILHYGRGDGTLSPRRQRTVIHLTDAIVAGQGEGPLSSTPIDAGLLTLGSSSAAVEWVHGLLMGIDPSKVPLTAHALAPQAFPLCDFGPEAIEVLVDGSAVARDDLFGAHGREFTLPRGWQAYDREEKPRSRALGA